MTPVKAKNNEVAQAIREIAVALSRREKSAKERRAEARIQWAVKLAEWGNLVFGGLVIAQVFSGNFNFDIALAGVILFLGTYLFAYWLMRGGGDG